LNTTLDYLNAVASLDSKHAQFIATSLAEIAEDLERRADEYHNRLESADGTQRDAAIRDTWNQAAGDTWNQAADILRRTTIKPRQEGEGP
jgi:hypothetical protein